MKKIDITKINKMLAETTRGYYTDEDWNKIYETISNLQDLCHECNLEIEFGVSSYGEGMLYKKWNFKISDSRKEVFGTIIAHAAGTVSDPLSRYDISAYI